MFPQASPRVSRVFARNFWDHLRREMHQFSGVSAIGFQGCMRQDSKLIIALDL